MQAGKTWYLHKGSDTLAAIAAVIAARNNSCTQRNGCLKAAMSAVCWIPACWKLPMTQGSNHSLQFACSGWTGKVCSSDGPNIRKCEYSHVRILKKYSHLHSWILEINIRCFFTPEVHKVLNSILISIFHNAMTAYDSVQHTRTCRFYIEKYCVSCANLCLCQLTHSVHVRVGPRPASWKHKKFNWIQNSIKLFMAELLQ